MQHDLQGTPQQGSAILAYGIAPKRPWSWKTFVIFSVAFVALCVSSIWAFANGVMVLMPKDRLAMARLTPKRILQKLPGNLVLDMAEPWRAAIQTGTVLLVFLGVWTDAD